MKPAAAAAASAAGVPQRDDPRYERLLRATAKAAAGGYEAVSMRDIARDTQMSLASVYRFCSSKDQLIAEAHAQAMADMRAQFAMNPPRGATPLARVTAVLRRIAGALEVDEARTRALMRAIYSSAAGVSDARDDAARAYEQMIDAAIGDDTVADRRVVIATIGHVIDSAIVNWLSGRYTAKDVRRILEQTARLLLGPRP